MLTKAGITLLTAGSSLAGAGISTGATIIIKNRQVSDLTREVDFISEERAERARMREENQKCRMALYVYNESQNNYRYYNSIDWRKRQEYAHEINK